MSGNSEKISALDVIIDKYQNSKEDFVAEQFVADLLASGFPHQDMLLLNEGTFERKYQNDIKKAYLDTHNKEELLHIVLRRSGIYDALPQGMLHDMQPTDSMGNIKDIVSEYHKRRDEQRTARRFFQPIEQELFLHRVFAVQNEARMLTDDYYDFLIDFWKLDKSCPQDYLNKLATLMPYARFITGKIEIIAKCLEYITNEAISINRVMEKKVLQTEEVSTNNWELGVNSIAGESFVHYEPVVEVKIGPVKRSDLINYLNTGKKYLFVDALLKYFLNAETTYNIVVELSSKESQFALEEKKSSFLGYSSVI